jgi:hypothetical protein
MTVVAATLCASASIAGAQTLPNGEPPRFTVEFAAGPTLGHKSSGFFDVEGTWHYKPKLDIFAEVGHMSNVGTSELDTGANAIAAFLTNVSGQPVTVSSTGIGVTHFDAGVKFWIDPIRPNILPYVLGGIGFASANTTTTFSANNTPLDPATFGAPLGADLSSRRTKAMLMFGGGITIPFGARYYADLGYRFGGILAKTGDVENDVAIKTQRIVFGVGARF